MHLFELNKIAGNHFNGKCRLTGVKQTGKVKIDKNVWELAHPSSQA